MSLICPREPIAVCTDPSGCQAIYQGTENPSYSGCATGSVCCMLPTTGSTESNTDKGSAMVGADNGASLTLERLQKEYQQVLQQYTQATQVTSTDEITPERRSLWNQLQARLHHINDQIQQNIMLSNNNNNNNPSLLSNAATTENDNLLLLQQEYDSLMNMKKEEAATQDGMLPVDREQAESQVMANQRYASYKWLFVVLILLTIVYLRILGFLQPRLTLLGFSLFLSTIFIYFFYRSFMMLTIVLGLLVLAFTLPLPGSPPLIEGPNGASSDGFSSGMGRRGTGSTSGFGLDGLGSSGLGRSGFGSSGFGLDGLGSSGFGRSGFGLDGLGSSGFGRSGFGREYD